MNVSLFVSKKIIKSNKSDYSRNIVKIAISTIAVCVMVMLLSIFIVFGFKHTIEDKVIGFTGDVSILPITLNNSFETASISLNDETLQLLKEDDRVTHLCRYAHKTGILKTQDAIEGVVLYGVSKDYSLDCFTGEILQGTFPTYTYNGTPNDSVVISATTANKLNLKVGEKISMYFVKNDSPAVRRFVIAGIYDSGFVDYDELYVFGDLKHIQKLNNWNNDMVSGYHVFLQKHDDASDYSMSANKLLDFSTTTRTYYQINPQVFDWLNLQDVNVSLLLTLMAVVCIITVISIMIILVIEKTSMIGVLKALGMNNLTIRKIFIQKSLYLTILGVIIGNLLAVVVSLLQLKFNFVRLSPESYYMSTVPIEFNLLAIIIVDIATIAICTLAMIAPSLLISKINPIASIKNE